MNFRGTKVRYATPTVRSVMFALYLSATWITGLSTAHACYCGDVDIGFLADREIEIPGNARGILWAGVVCRNGLVELTPDDRFTVELELEGRWLRLPTRVDLIHHAGVWTGSVYDVLLIGAVEGMSPGQRYRFTYHARPNNPVYPLDAEAFQDSQEVYVTVSVDEFEGGMREIAATAVQNGRLSLATGGGMCVEELPASWIDTESIVPEGLRKWQDSLFYTTFVDGRPWHPKDHLCSRIPPGRTWRECGSDRFYRVAEYGDEPVGETIDRRDGTRAILYRGVGSPMEPGLDVGSFRVEIHAWLPGTSERLVAHEMYSFPNP